MLRCGRSAKTGDYMRCAARGRRAALRNGAVRRSIMPVVVAVEAVLDLQSRGAQVLDTRDPAEFASAHLAGSINIGLGGQYATWAGTFM